MARVVELECARCHRDFEARYPTGVQPGAFSGGAAYCRPCSDYVRAVDRESAEKEAKNAMDSRLVPTCPQCGELAGPVGRNRVKRLVAAGTCWACEQKRLGAALRAARAAKRAAAGANGDRPPADPGEAAIPAPAEVSPAADRDVAPPAPAVEIAAPREVPVPAAPGAPAPTRESVSAPVAPLSRPPERPPAPAVWPPAPQREPARPLAPAPGGRDGLGASVSSLLAECREIRELKGADYSGDRDPLANFTSGAATFGVPPRVVLGIYLSKHLAAVNAYVKDGHVQSEPIRGRIVDAINYLLLLNYMNEVQP